VARDAEEPVEEQRRTMHGGSVALSAVWPQCAAEESKVDGFFQDVRRELGMTGRLGRKKEPQATKLHKFIQAINKLVYRTNVSALEALEQVRHMEFSRRLLIPSVTMSGRILYNTPPRYEDHRGSDRSDPHPQQRIRFRSLMLASLPHP
jgi:hypothetical protein